MRSTGRTGATRSQGEGLPDTRNGWRPGSSTNLSRYEVSPMNNALNPDLPFLSGGQLLEVASNLEAKVA